MASTNIHITIWERKLHRRVQQNYYVRPGKRMDTLHQYFIGNGKPKSERSEFQANKPNTIQPNHDIGKVS